MIQLPDNERQKDVMKITTLAKRQDFLRIASGRKKWVAQSMIVQIAEKPPTENQDSTTDNLTIRVGYTASKKVGNAVRRNRAKRRLREVARKILPLYGKKDHDYVLIARTSSVEMSFDQLIRDFKWCLKRLGSSKSVSEPSEKSDKTHGNPEQTLGKVTNK